MRSPNVRHCTTRTGKMGTPYVKHCTARTGIMRSPNVKHCTTRTRYREDEESKCEAPPVTIGALGAIQPAYKLTEKGEPLWNKENKGEGEVWRSVCRTLVYSVKCPVHVRTEMGLKIGLCLIPLRTESVKFRRRSDPFCVHKWPSVASFDPCAYVLWLLTRACQPQKLYPEIFY